MSYLLKGKRTVLAWCRDKQNTWETELRDGQKPEVLKGIAVNLGISKARSVKIYDPWTNRWTNGKIKNGKVALPQFSRSIVIRAEV